MTLLRDIQNSAINSESKLSDLLRKCKVLAARLQNDVLNQWVDAELNGYSPKDNLPAYRIIHCNAAGNLGGPFGAEMRNITIPVACLPEKWKDWAQTCYLRHPVSSLEELSKGEGDILHSDWPGNLIATVATKIYRGYSLYAAWLIISKSDIIAILDTVRNRILNFVLEIEKENPEAGEAQPNTKPIPEEKVTQVFNMFITGNVQNLATGSSNFIQSDHRLVLHGDFASLSSFLKSVGVTDGDIIELDKAIKEDEAVEQEKGFGEKVSSWIGKMLSKAGTAAWSISTSAAGALLAKAIARYYGLE
jgi:hypothetical protein